MKEKTSDEYVDENGLPSRLVYVRDSRNGDHMRTVLDGILVAAIVGLVGAVWNMSNNVAAMSVQISDLSREFHTAQQEAHK